MVIARSGVKGPRLIRAEPELNYRRKGPTRGVRRRIEAQRKNPRRCRTEGCEGRLEPNKHLCPSCRTMPKGDRQYQNGCGTAKRLKRSNYVNASDIMASPYGMTGKLIERILAGTVELTF